ncbi:MAG: AAA family ATPase [Proteobacteria bacterium]|nr:AAA family ATPase [Pseudomonadota bacterium]
MNLGLGYESFEDLRADQCYYVDKTDLLYKMIKDGRYYFLSRPKGFGKSLLVSTLECLFEGKKELFKGLYIEDKWDWSQKYPVVRLNFTGCNRYTDGPESDIDEQLSDYEENHDFDPDDVSGNRGRFRFRRLIKHLHNKTGKQVVVLVDEYDAPILDVITDEDLAKKNRDYLRYFYREIKRCSCAKYIRFVFVTGITMFSEDNIFAGLDNLEDISLDPVFSSICGYTDHDIDTVFSEQIKNLDRKEIKLRCNGYSWLGEKKVYNPFCMLFLFRKKGPGDWWSETGTPQYLYECLVKFNSVSLKDVEDCWIDRTALTQFEVDSAIPQAIFFQAGYLTIVDKKRENSRTQYLLEYPNLEMRNGAYYGLLEYLTGDFDKAKKQGETLVSFLANNNFDGFKETFYAFLSSIPYENKKKSNVKGYYNSIIQGMLYAIGIEYNAEKSSSLGKCDLVIFYKHQVFVVEFKMQRLHQKVGIALKEAIQHIKDCHYVDEYKKLKKPIHLLAMVFSKEERNIVGILHEKCDYDSA